MIRYHIYSLGHVVYTVDHPVVVYEYDWVKSGGRISSLLTMDSVCRVNGISDGPLYGSSFFNLDECKRNTYFETLGKVTTSSRNDSLVPFPFLY